MFNFNLASYLEKFKHLKDPKEDKTAITKIILEVTSVAIPEKDLSIRKGTVFIQGNTLAKTRVFFKKEEVVRKIKETLPDLHIKEII